MSFKLVFVTVNTFLYFTCITISSNSILTRAELPVWQINSEYQYNNNDIPLVQVFRRCMPKKVFTLLEEAVQALLYDRETSNKQQHRKQLRHGKVS